MTKQEVLTFMRAANDLAKTIVYEDAMQEEEPDIIDARIVDDLLQTTFSDEELVQLTTHLPGNHLDWASYLTALLKGVRRDFLNA